jgi:hypothetical protein
MLIVLLTALSAAPSAAALADSGKLHGYLVTPVQYGGETQSEVPLSQMTREQLKAEYKRLDEEKPGLGGQITMIALGGATLGIGAVTLWISFLIGIGLSSTVPLVPLLVGAGLVLGGGALLTVGIIMLRMARAEREPFHQAQEEIQRRLDGSYESPGQPPPMQPDRYDPVPPPPPPPPPPGAGFPAVRPSLVLATF